MTDDIEYVHHPTVELIERWGSDRKVAQAARTSTLGLDNDRERIEGLVKSMWGARPVSHLGPFEHSGMTIGLDVPLFVRDQLVRHKSFSFSIQSGRYTEFAPRFYVPGEHRHVAQDPNGRRLDYKREPGTDLQREFVDHSSRFIAKIAWQEYSQMIAEGIAPEVARNVLPASIMTHMWMTGSLRSWLHFLDTRLDQHAQAEIRWVAEAIESLIGVEFPVSHEAYWARRYKDSQ